MFKNEKRKTLLDYTHATAAVVLSTADPAVAKILTGNWLGYKADLFVTEDSDL